jgi:hypothetical protein
MSEMQTFEGAWESLSAVIKNMVTLVSENRRPYVARRVANSLLFRAASSFIFYNRAPTRNEASLNEAIELRDSAMQYYEDDEERFKADIEGIVNFFSPEAPVAVARKGKGKEDPLVKAARARLAERKAEIDEEAERERVFIEAVIPDLEGFLGGANYKRIDLQGSEMAKDRAKMAAVKAAAAIKDRVHRDTLLCGKNLDDAVDKYEASNTYANKQQLAYWSTEYELADADLKEVEAAIKAEGLQEE